jgi:hypothetical protein
MSHSNGEPSASSTLVTASVISGPIPSPGIRVAGILPDMVAITPGVAVVEEEEDQ